MHAARDKLAADASRYLISRRSLLYGAKDHWHDCVDSPSKFQQDYKIYYHAINCNIHVDTINQNDDIKDT